MALKLLDGKISEWTSRGVDYLLDDKILIGLRKCPPRLDIVAVSTIQPELDASVMPVVCLWH